MKPSEELKALFALERRTWEDRKRFSDNPVKRRQQDLEMQITVILDYLDKKLI